MLTNLNDLKITYSIWWLLGNNLTPNGLTKLVIEAKAESTESPENNQTKTENNPSSDEESSNLLPSQESTGK